MSAKQPTPQGISALLRKAGASDRNGEAPECSTWGTAVLVTWDLVAGVDDQTYEFAERVLNDAGYLTHRGWSAQQGMKLLASAADPACGECGGSGPCPYPSYCWPGGAPTEGES
jgi:hypothetical protein